MDCQNHRLLCTKISCAINWRNLELGKKKMLMLFYLCIIVFPIFFYFFFILICKFKMPFLWFPLPTLLLTSLMLAYFVQIYKMPFGLVWYTVSLQKQHGIRIQKRVEISSSPPFERKISSAVLVIPQNKVSQFWSWEYSGLSQCIWLDTNEWLCLLGWPRYFSLWCGR